MACSNDSKYSKPLPWIGLYVAAASLACALAMAIDGLLRLRKRKLWFPCKYFSLNATSLALIAIATKLPVDLNTNMPRWEDQLTKLTSTIFLCTDMGNFLPSLGELSDEEMISNIVALGMSVITVIVNVGIQMGTGVIFVFWPEHAIILFFMLVLLVILSSSALTISTTKQLLEKQYNKKYDLVRGESDEGENFTVTELRENVNKYWMMAHTCSPQYVLGRSALCCASGAFCLLSALVLVEAVLRAQLSGRMGFCDGNSDYEWSTMLIFASQVIAIAVGTIVPASRWFSSMSFSGSRAQGRHNQTDLRVEKYWVQRLVEWKESPLPFQITSRRFRRMAYSLRSQILNLCIQIQKAVVITSKLIRLASTLSMFLVSKFIFKTCKRLLLKDRLRTMSMSSSNLSIGDFVLHLEGEEGLVHLIMKKGYEATKQWVNLGRKHQPTHLLELLQKCTASQGFRGIGEFDSEHVQSIVSEEPSNCWSLPLVTLVSIAVSLPGTDPDTIDRLLKGVYEGLRYVKLIEKNLDTKGLTNMRDAAHIFWQGVDLHDQWFDYDLHKSRLEEQNPKEVLEKLAAISKKCVLEFMTKGGCEQNPLEWPVKALAANSMYRISQTTLMKHKNRTEKVEELFQWLCTTIADIFGACLTNLRRVIPMECFCNTIEVREAKVREAAYLLGETEKMLEIIGQDKFSGLDTESMADIDKWHLSKQNNA
ncbi:hypothetical protein H6P81_005256 [Aristolochia fimbriata]|uniref:Uncharacterized protein n=1 Tax=Aristolochia fimbriata TaxID=158543 RepID=A0AAV7EXH2_ARIFI|nr:hypothetical protein H6P81_005256 [Aristolochia fimbriata]